MKPPRSLFAPFLLFIAFSAVGVLPAHAGKTYCCSDDQGRRLCGDMVPNECYGRAYFEVGPNGSILKRIEAPLTAQQREQRDAEAARKKEQELAAKEEKRRNDALLNAYASEKDIDFMLQRALADLAVGTKEIQVKYDEAVKRKQKLDGELEFYKKKPVPQSLKDQIKSSEAEIKTQQIALEARKKEEDKVKLKFEEDRKRYLELTQGRKGTTTSGTSTQSAAHGAESPSTAKTK